VLCDAGGGTVVGQASSICLEEIQFIDMDQDLISYRVRQVVPSLELEEVAIGTG
jgi:hypothetical protein